MEIELSVAKAQTMLHAKATFGNANDVIKSFVGKKVR